LGLRLRVGGHRARTVSLENRPRSDAEVVLSVPEYPWMTVSTADQPGPVARRLHGEPATYRCPPSEQLPRQQAAPAWAMTLRSGAAGLASALYRGLSAARAIWTQYPGPLGTPAMKVSTVRAQCARSTSPTTTALAGSFGVTHRSIRSSVGVRVQLTSAGMLGVADVVLLGGRCAVVLPGGGEVHPLAHRATSAEATKYQGRAYLAATLTILARRARGRA
jgi:hypothetical protein